MSDWSLPTLQSYLLFLLVLISWQHKGPGLSSSARHRANLNSTQIYDVWKQNLLKNVGAADSVVEVVTMARPRRCGVRNSSGAWIFLSSKLSRRAVRLSLPLFNGYRGSCPGLTCLGRHFDHLPSSVAVVENEWRHMSAPPYVPSWRGQGLYVYVGMCET